MTKIKSYAAFYPFYLGEHSNITCRRLHVLGSTLGLACFGMAVYKGSPQWVAAGFLAGYACAWVGHFVFEKNKPATFKQPFYSFVSDWRMFYHVLTGQLSLVSTDKDTLPLDYKK